MGGGIDQIKGDDRVTSQGICLCRSLVVAPKGRTGGRIGGVRGREGEVMSVEMRVTSQGMCRCRSLAAAPKGRTGWRIDGVRGQEGKVKSVEMIW